MQRKVHQRQRKVEERQQKGPPNAVRCSESASHHKSEVIGTIVSGYSLCCGLTVRFDDRLELLHPGRHLARLLHGAAVGPRWKVVKGAERLVECF